VACGYSQVPSINFTESYTPVINDVSFRINLIRMMIWNMKAKIIDIETAFLHSDLEESIFMEIPNCMGLGDGKCLVVKKTIFGLVQSTIQFYVNLVKVVKSFGFKGGFVDPCLRVN
jgi:hypothetical protein